ncbi:MAG: CPBP family intramembrane glutamic endopeptidase [Bacteroidota bacterium]|jgi:membrane protease YdiL (CAAX protease family)|nr:CPBP family intramembrane glutamic endopeptidase [Bacteroidota bacterium]
MHENERRDTEDQRIVNSDTESETRDATFRQALASAALRANQPPLHPVAFGFLLVLVTFVGYQLFGGIITYLLFGVDTAANVAGVRAVTVVSQLLFLMLPALLLTRFMGWDLREALRLRWPRLRPLFAVVVSVIALQFVVQAWVELQQHVMREYLLPDALLPILDLFEDLIEELYGTLLAMHTPVEAFTVWIVIALTPACCEEILFRGAVQYSFEKKMRLRWAFLLAGAIFSFFHLNPVTFIPLTLLGAYFSVLTWRGDSLGYAFAAHATNNTIAVVALYFFRSENLLPADATSGAPSPGMYAASGSIALVVFAVCAWYFWTVTASRKAESQP